MPVDALDTIMPVASATAQAPGKLNLTLGVHGRRSDGYHEISSLVIGVDLCDRLRLRVLESSGIRLRCDNPSLATADNLAYKAAAVLGRRIGLRPALEIELEKRIPIGGGMGGGSSDAAATLRACNALWESELSDAKLAELGATLGSDVPLFFSLPSAVVFGRGERVQPVKMRWSGWVLLLTVDAVVSTAAVYRAWRTSDGSTSAPEVIEVILSASSAAEFNHLPFNDLQSAVFRICPAVAEVHDALHRAGVGPFHVTGAGSTLFGTFDHGEEAVRVAHRVEKLKLGVHIAVAEAPVGPGKILLGEDA